MSATARLKKLFNFVKREAVFLQFVQAGHNDHELVLFLQIKHKNIQKYVRVDEQLHAFFNPSRQMSVCSWVHDQLFSSSYPPLKTYFCVSLDRKLCVTVRGHQRVCGLFGLKKKSETLEDRKCLIQRLGGNLNYNLRLFQVSYQVSAPCIT